MRWMYWVSMTVLICGLVDSALGFQPGCGCQNSAAVGQPSYAALSGEACCSPAGYALTPGCCEYSRPCCNNAWAGYCAHRAKVDAFWSRVGVPRSARCMGIDGEATPACNCDSNNTMMQPTPASQPALPEKSGQNARPAVFILK